MELYDAHELEAYLKRKLSYWTILERAKRGEIPHLKIGRKVFFRKESIDAWLIGLEAGSVKSIEDAPKYGQLRRIHA